MKHYATLFLTTVGQTKESLVLLFVFFSLNVFPSIAIFFSESRLKVTISTKANFHSCNRDSPINRDHVKSPYGTLTCGCSVVDWVTCDSSFFTRHATKNKSKYLRTTFSCFHCFPMEGHNLFSTFCLDRNLTVKNLNWCVIWTIKTRFFPIVKSEINCPSDGLVETTKSSLPFFSCCWPIS